MVAYLIDKLPVFALGVAGGSLIAVAATVTSGAGAGAGADMDTGTATGAATGIGTGFEAAAGVAADADADAVMGTAVGEVGGDSAPVNLGGLAGFGGEMMIDGSAVAAPLVDGTVSRGADSG